MKRVAVFFCFIEGKIKRLKNNKQEYTKKKLKKYGVTNQKMSIK